MSATSCLIARTATVALRDRLRGEVREVTVVFPANWKRSTLLRYVRREHPAETARIIAWRTTAPEDAPWEPSLWLANPRAFADYRAGRLAA